MHRIWIGLDPKIIMSVLGSFIAGTVLVIHMFAFSVVNYPASVKAMYSDAPSATR